MIWVIGEIETTCTESTEGQSNSNWRAWNGVMEEESYHVACLTLRGRLEGILGLGRHINKGSETIWGMVRKSQVFTGCLEGV
jgi:hypothetical protein